MLGLVVSGTHCIIKEYEEPNFNVEVDKLLFNYRALYWARNTEKFQFSDAFMDIYCDNTNVVKFGDILCMCCIET